MLKFERLLEYEKQMPRSRAEKMSRSSVGDSNHEYMRRNGAKSLDVMRLRRARAERGRGNNLANNGN